MKLDRALPRLTPVPWRTPLAMSIGLGVYAISTYGFLAIAARALGPDRYGDFSTLWALIYGVCLGAVLPLEQEVSRIVAEFRGSGAPAAAWRGPVANLSFAISIFLTLASLPLLPHLLSSQAGNVLMCWGAVGVAALGLATAYTSRGFLAGQRRFGTYARQLMVEGFARLGGALLLAWAGVTSVGAFGLVVGAALLVAVALTTRSPAGRGGAVSALSPRRLRAAYGKTLLSTGIAQAIVNAGPACVAWLSSGSSDPAVGRFMAASVIGRIPLFLFTAVQVTLIPLLVEAGRESGQAQLLRRTLQVLLATAGLALLAVTFSATCGPMALRSLFGPELDMPVADISLLAVGLGLYLAATAVQPAVLALHEQGWSAVSWLCAGAVFLAVCASPLAPTRAVEIATIAATTTALLGLLGRVVWKCGRETPLGERPLSRLLLR